MNIAQIRKYSPSPSNIKGWICFQLGLFFLASSALLAGLFLLLSLIFGSLNRRESYFRDAWNYPFLVVAFLMLFGCFNAYSGWLSWVGLANWIPCFWCFWGFQPYLLTIDARRRSALCLLAGTFPVLLTGFGQLWFNWQGPWELFNGLIVWFVALGGNPLGRFSGLFDYANIAGAWLALVWPFSLAFMFQPSFFNRRRLFAFLFVFGIAFALVLTNSRNAWGAFVLAIPFVLGPHSWIWLLPCLFVALFPVAIAILPTFNSDLQNLARNIVPESIWTRLNDFQFFNKRPLEVTRIHQWHLAIDFISQRPIFGWGAAAFSLLYPLRTGFWHGHSHNLPLELAVSHGFPVAFILVGTVLFLLLLTLKKVILTTDHFLKSNKINLIFDRAWWTSGLILVFLHGSDIPLFDSRINIAGWIILAGLRCSLRTRIENKLV